MTAKRFFEIQKILGNIDDKHVDAAVKKGFITADEGKGIKTKKPIEKGEKKA